MKNRADLLERFGVERSKTYDQRIMKVIPAYEAMHTLAEHLLSGNLSADAKLLLCGAGTGQEVVRYATNNPNWKITGFDLSAGMLELAREKIRRQALDSQKIHLLEGTIDAITEADFDAATSILVMHFIPDNGAKQAYLNEIFRRLKKNAMLILVDMVGAKNTETHNFYLSQWKHFHLKMRDDPENVEEDFQRIEELVHPVSEDRMMALLQTAGFGRITQFYQALLFKGYVTYKL